MQAQMWMMRWRCGVPAERVAIWEGSFWEGSYLGGRSPGEPFTQLGILGSQLCRAGGGRGGGRPALHPFLDDGSGICGEGWRACEWRGRERRAHEHAGGVYGVNASREWRVWVEGVGGGCGWKAWMEGVGGRRGWRA